MTDVPEEAVRGLTPKKRAVAEAWWRELDDASRREFTTLWDARTDDTAYCATIEEGRTVWHALPLTLHGFHAGTESAKENAFWQEQLREYIDGHEVKFFLAQRTFHVCRAHAVAREVIATGIVPADFACPFANDACPFAAALDRAAEGGIRKTLWLVPRVDAQR